MYDTGPGDTGTGVFVKRMTPGPGAQAQDDFKCMTPGPGAQAQEYLSNVDGYNSHSVFRSLRFKRRREQNVASW